MPTVFELRRMIRVLLPSYKGGQFYKVEPFFSYETDRNTNTIPQHWQTESIISYERLEKGFICCSAYIHTQYYGKILKTPALIGCKLIEQNYPQKLPKLPRESPYRERVFNIARLNNVILLKNDLRYWNKKPE